MSEVAVVGFLEVVIDGRKQKIELAEGVVCRIGRAARNNLVLTSSQVSRDHALADCPQGKDCYITDLGSLNGTHVNGVRITAPTALRHGDVISVGEFRLSFQRCGAPLEESEESSGEETAVRVQQEEITVLVMDIRDYTGMSQRMSAEKLSEVVGYFFRESGALLKAQGAWGQKYMGDAVMAIWVHSDATPAGHTVQRALLSAYSIQQIALSLQQRFSLGNAVGLSVALNSGVATLGNLGSDAAADYTALGETINLAFRLETATRDVPCDVLVGAATFDHLDASMGRMFTTRELRLKGYASSQAAHAISFEGLSTVLGLSRQTIQI